MSTGIKSRCPARTVPISSAPQKRLVYRPQRQLATLCEQLVQSLPQRRLRRQGLDSERMYENHVFSVKARFCEVGVVVAEHARHGQQNITVAYRIAATNLEVFRQVLPCWCS